MATVLVGGLLTVAAGGASAQGATSAPTPGTVFVSDRDTSEVFELPPGGGPKTTIGTDLHQPDGLTVDNAGDVFIADTGNNRVVEVPGDGGPQTTVGTGLSSPKAVAVDAAGDVFVADSGNDRVVEVPAGGGPQKTVAKGNQVKTELKGQPDAVAVDGAGDLFFLEYADNGVVEVPAGGGPRETIDEGGLSSGGLAVDAAGDIYYSGSSDGDYDGVTELPAGGGPQRIIASNLDSVVSVALDAAGAVLVGETGKVAEVPAGGCHAKVSASDFDFVGGVALYAPKDGSPTRPRTGTIGASTGGAAPVVGPVAAGIGAPARAVPAISEVYPDYGSAAGGTKIAIIGSGFTSADTVEIGQGKSPAIPATDVQVDSPTEIQATTGGGARGGDYFHVSVSAGGASSVASPHDVFHYEAPPTVSSVSPASGPVGGCTPTVVTGTGFLGTSAVEIGQGDGAGTTAIPALDVDVVSPTEMTVTTGSDARPGRWYLFVKAAGGTSTQKSKLNAYAYTPTSG